MSERKERHLCHSPSTFDIGKSKNSQEIGLGRRRGEILDVFSSSQGKCESVQKIAFICRPAFAEAKRWTKAIGEK